jgi:hypothetical protein
MSLMFVKSVGLCVVIYVAIAFALSKAALLAPRFDPLRSLGEWVSKVLTNAKDHRALWKFVPPLWADWAKRGLRASASLPIGRIIEFISVLLALPFLQQLLTGSMSIASAMTAQFLIGFIHYYWRGISSPVTFLTWPGYATDAIRIPLRANGIEPTVLECQQEQIREVLSALTRTSHSAQLQALIVDLEQLQGLTKSKCFAPQFAEIRLDAVFANREDEAFVNASQFSKALSAEALGLNGKLATVRFLPIRFGFNGVCWRRQCGYHDRLDRMFDARRGADKLYYDLVSLLTAEAPQFVGFYDWWFLQMLLAAKLVSGDKFETALKEIQFDSRGELLSGVGPVGAAVWEKMQPLLMLLRRKGKHFTTSRAMRDALQDDRASPFLFVGPADSFCSGAIENGYTTIHKSFLGSAGGFVWVECLAFLKGAKRTPQAVRDEVARVLVSRVVQSELCDGQGDEFYACSPYFPSHPAASGVAVPPRYAGIRNWLSKEVAAIDLPIAYGPPNPFECIEKLRSRDFLRVRPSPEPLLARNWRVAYDILIA